MQKKITSYLMRVLPVAAALVALTAAIALASGGGEGGEHAASPWVAFGAQVFNFALIVGILVYFGRKPIRDGLRARIDDIARNIEDARNARESARKALAEAEEKFNAREREIREMMEVAVSAGQREREALIKEGERMSAKIVEQARAGIEFELKQARQTLRAEAAEYALELAEKKIGQKVTADDQKRLFEDALKRLEDRS